MIRRNYGEGTFINVNDRYEWFGRYQDLDGKLRRKHIVAKDKKNLKAKVKEWLLMLDDRRHLKAKQDLTLEEWSNIWLRVRQGTAKDSTYQFYYSLVHNHIIPGLGQCNLKDLKPLNIQTWLNGLIHPPKDSLTIPLSAKTVNSIRTTLITILNYAKINSRIKINPALETNKVIGSKKTIIALTIEQSKKLLKVARDGNYLPDFDDDGKIYLKKCYYAAIFLATFTGMRKGEVFGLLWSDIDFSKKMIVLRHNLVLGKLGTPKTPSSNRNVILDNKTINVLKAWKDYQEDFQTSVGKELFNNENNAVFTNAFGHFVSVDNFVHRHWKWIKKAANLPDDLGFHAATRHTHISQLLAAGVNVKVVSERTGDSAEMIYKTYAHVLPSMQAAAIKAIAEFQK